MIKRTIQPVIEQMLFKGKIILIYGARRTGKTTLAKMILSTFGEAGRYINCELEQNRQALETTNSELLSDFLRGCKIAVLDEAQSIPDIGLTLKVLADTFPTLQIIATGSSSFDIAQKVSEPLTGRSRTFTLYPLSFQEIVVATDPIQAHARIETFMRFGMYPEVVSRDESSAKEELQDIATNYLYKDVLAYQRLRRSDLLQRLVTALALQIGNEVSYGELARLLGENHHTIRIYIDLLEKSFVVRRLPAFSRNLRKELSKSFKIYFLDLGIRNSLINNYNPMDMRTDAGALWENFCVMERIKHLHNLRSFPNLYFWRTYDQKEIDFIEESGGRLNAVEFKWNASNKTKPPKEFLQTYPESTFQFVHPGNVHGFLTGNETS